MGSNCINEFGFYTNYYTLPNPTQEISALSRDTTNTLNELGHIFDKQKIEEQQELAAAFGEEAFRLAHNLPDDGSGRKVAVHAIIGGIMSQITGTGFASGAIGAGVNEAIIGEIKKIKDPGTAQIISAIVGAAAAKAVGGNTGAGAAAAASGTKNNWLGKEQETFVEELSEALESQDQEKINEVLAKYYALSNYSNFAHQKHSSRLEKYGIVAKKTDSLCTFSQFF